MFQKKKKKSYIEHKEYDRSIWKPILKCSICNGEQVAGFRNIQTGEVEEIAFIHDQKDLQEFLDTYGLEDIDKVY
ncbi:MAG: aspartate dehydrogenase [Lachnospiraceae bacterium]|nr:aspartate dehydrogenase [Lachnospiraceae bacterium]